MGVAASASLCDMSVRCARTHTAARRYAASCASLLLGFTVILSHFRCIPHVLCLSSFRRTCHYQYVLFTHRRTSRSPPPSLSHPAPARTARRTGRRSPPGRVVVVVKPLPLPRLINMYDRIAFPHRSSHLFVSPFASPSLVIVCVISSSLRNPGSPHRSFYHTHGTLSISPPLITAPLLLLSRCPRHWFPLSPPTVLCIAPLCTYVSA